VVVEDIGGTAWARRRDSSEFLRFDERGAIDQPTYASLFTEHIAAFVDAIRTGEPFAADAWAGLRHLEIDAAISESIATGRPARVERYLPGEGRTIFTAA
jgi:predicted dehydrogenase